MSQLPHVNQPAYGQPAQYGQPAYVSSQPYPQPYGRPPFQPLPEHSEGTTILILGILGFVVFPCGIVAWYMGNKALKEIRASGIRYSNESNINVGKILGMVTSILGMVAVGLVLVQVVFYLVYVAAMMSVVAS
ncbi:DUF4190 domain-containing protein [Microlunatus speluncae]|uniref:DUF4190 domain-containing protein n=1 Tax=Microlunatus speluncae TaxID=2594267 RepID=UPI00126628D0|nr:DUF4190 domain-containing protein [Microlunatus speluncae]